jgi:hypothetical protein
MLKRLIAAVLKAFLMILDKVFLLARKKVVPLYPYDKRTKAITLPKEVERQLRRLVAEGNKVEAIRQVKGLPGQASEYQKTMLTAWQGKIAAGQTSATGTLNRLAPNSYVTDS